MASANFGLPLLTENQAGAATRYNYFQAVFDAFFQGKLKSATTAAEPGSPADGDVYWTTGSATGTNWAGHSNSFAAYLNGSWSFVAPGAAQEGWRFRAQDTDLYWLWSGSALVAEAATGVSAAGNNQGAATLLVNRLSIVTTVTGGSADGVRLPASWLSAEFIVVNTTGTTLNVYPESGGAIDGGSTNAAVTVAGGKATTFYGRGSSLWYTEKGA